MASKKRRKARKRRRKEGGNVLLVASCVALFGLAAVTFNIERNRQNENNARTSESLVPTISSSIASSVPTETTSVSTETAIVPPVTPTPTTAPTTETSSPSVSPTPPVKTEKTVRFYFAGATEIGYDVVYEDRIVTIDEGKEVSVKQILEDELKKPPGKDQFSPTLNDDVKIQAINIKDDIAIVDFNSSLAQANLGSESQSNMFRCIVNTIGGYYQVDKVCVTIGGQPFAGEIAMEEGGYLMVNKDLVRQYNP